MAFVTCVKKRMLIMAHVRHSPCATLFAIENVDSSPCEARLLVMCSALFSSLPTADLCHVYKKLSSNPEGCQPSTRKLRELRRRCFPWRRRRGGEGGRTKG